MHLSLHLVPDQEKTVFQLDFVVVKWDLLANVLHIVQLVDENYVIERPNRLLRVKVRFVHEGVRDVSDHQMGIKEVRHFCLIRTSRSCITCVVSKVIFLTL